MSEKKKNNHRNPLAYFWEMASGGLLSENPGAELTPDEEAGEKPINRENQKEKDIASGDKRLHKPENGERA